MSEKRPVTDHYIDDLLILRKINDCEVMGDSATLSTGLDLLRSILGGVHSPSEAACRTFIRELELASAAGYLAFDLLKWTAPGMGGVDRVGALNYLIYLRDVRLTLAGRDRAQCRVFEADPPDPADDDGSPITVLTFDRLAGILATSYPADDLALFLQSGDVPADLIPDLKDEKSGLLKFFRLFDEGSARRRVVRTFLGRWLSQSLASGPNSDDETELLQDLARQGWYVREGRLVRGESIERIVRGPRLSEDLLANLHPRIREVAASLFAAGHRAAAIFEAVKAVDIRVADLSGIEGTGKPLMGRALTGSAPVLHINGGQSQTDRDEQEGFALIFMGTMMGVRNPKAHTQFEEIEERRALDYLGLASLLMRRLDDAGAQRPSQPSRCLATDPPPLS